MNDNDITKYRPNGLPNRQQHQPAAPQEEVNYYYADPADETHLRDYWKILRKRIRFIIPVFLTVVAVGLLISFSSPTLYTALSTLQIEPNNPTVTGIAETAPSQSGAGPYDYYQTQFSLLDGRPLAARVIKDLNLETNPVFRGGKTSNAIASLFSWITSLPGRAIEAIFQLFENDGEKPAPGIPTYELGVSPGLVGRYRSYLTVQPVRTTRLVNISFSTPDAKLSQNLANAHATGFIQMVLESRFNMSKEARDFLGKKLVELREKVQRAELALNRFRQKHGVFSMEKGENIIVDRLVDLNKQLTVVRTERIQAESLFRMTKNKNSQHLQLVLNDPLILQLKGTIATLETDKGRLSSIFTPSHPRLEELNQQLGEAKRALTGAINNVVQGIEMTYAAARSKEEALEAEAKRQQDTALDLKEVSVDYAVLNEEVIVNRGLYDNVLKRMNETGVANDLAAANIQLVQRAEVPSMPSSPNTTFALIISSILGLFVSVGLAFFLEYMDATLSTPEGVWAAVSMTTLGVVPHLKSLRHGYKSTLPQGARSQLEPPEETDDSISKELVVVRDRMSIVAESYRTIRTALLLSQAEHAPKVILITSPCPGEGKTVTTLNLSVALAQAGHKVLVIDADLRKGRCHHMINVSNHGGLSNVLTGHLGLQQAIQKTGIKDLYVLPRGALAPNPVDLLMSQKMRDVLRELRESFDFIVIDTPPAIAVSDAAVLSVMCDGVVLVVNGNMTTTPTARRAVERLEKVGAPLLGAILNGIDIRDPDYVDYRTYYASYDQGAAAQSKADEDEVIRSVDDVDRVMAKMGLDGKTVNIPEFNGGRQNHENGRRDFRDRRFIDRVMRKVKRGFGASDA
ncbi:MAG: polysaccharide biosynthesis tyrosine autokinase [Candidatus Binatia bacterium]